MNTMKAPISLQSFILLTILSYYLLIPTYATHFVFVKSGVTSDGARIEEERVERVARYIGIDVHLHMHHQDQQHIQADQENQLGEQQAHVLTINHPMTIEEIDRQLSLAFNNLERVVPSNSVDFYNLKILIEQLKKKIDKCNSDVSSSESSDVPQHTDDADEHSHVTETEDIEQDSNESINDSNMDKATDESQPIPNSQETVESQTHQHNNQSSQNTTQSEHAEQEINKPQLPTDVPSEHLEIQNELEQLQKAFNEELNKGLNDSKTTIQPLTDNKTNITNTTQQSESVEIAPKELSEIANKLTNASNSSSESSSDSAESNSESSEFGPKEFSQHANKLTNASNSSSESSSESAESNPAGFAKAEVHQDEDKSDKEKIIKEFEKLATMLDLNDAQREKLEDIKKKIQAELAK